MLPVDSTVTVCERDIWRHGTQLYNTQHSDTMRNVHQQLAEHIDI